MTIDVVARARTDAIVLESVLTRADHETYQHGAALEDALIENDDQTLGFVFAGDGGRHWLRADVRSADGEQTLAIGNPIYLNR